MAGNTLLLDTVEVLVVGSAPWLDDFAEQLTTQAGATVRTVETAAKALAAVENSAVDCVVTELDLGEETGVDLVEGVRDADATVPTILATDDGNEAIASDAVRAGVTDYVVVEGADAEGCEELLDRTEAAVRSVRRTVTRRERARQFDAVFHDSQTATWVLDPDGTLARVNRVAREIVEEDADALVGETFWTLPWWSSAATERDVRQLVENAREGQFASAVVTEPAGPTDRVVELSVRPVENERGDLASIVVEGLDVTEQVSLERDLRRSEELHRVTLNNMTDTVLITDESGEYTYVCPNVHFIFGYTAEEIHEQGTIDALLGEDLFDRAELAENGVLKNIECTATDKAGREHTLLVNVREVSIRDGTLLYSCRDITKRKQREESLATLQDTAREFLYAETHQEIAQHVVDDAPGVLGIDACAVYMYDVDTNDLRPVVHSQAMTELNGPLPTVSASTETLPGYSFVDDETLVFDDVHTADRLGNPATDLRSTIHIPLGDHGVFVAGTDEVGAFDAVQRELADLLAATAEAALDRVSRESRLREQDRELQRQNEQLTALNRINTTIREIDQGIVQAETREEILHTVCERLTDHDRFSFAWVGSVDSAAETVEPRVWAGGEQGYLDTRTVSVGTVGTEPAGQTAASGGATMVANVAERLREDPWRSEALTRDFLSVLSIPLVYNDFTHGVLTVYAEERNAFGEMTQAVLTELGETIAAALSAVERKQALLAASVTRVEMVVEDSSFLLSRLASAADCTLSYRGSVQQSADGDRVFVSVTDADVAAVAETAAGLAVVNDVTEISPDGAGGGVLQLHLAEPFLAGELADHGAIFQDATAHPETTTLVVDVPDGIEVRNITQLLEETFSSVTLRRKQTLETPAVQTLRERFLEKLTDRQLEVLQTAYYAGFFASPREHTGEEIADTLDISPPAFYQHIRGVQRKLFTTLFDESSPQISGVQ